MSNITELAKACGVSRKTVYQWCAKNGFEKDAEGRYRLSVDDEQSLLEHYAGKKHAHSPQPQEPEKREQVTDVETLLVTVLQEKVKDLRKQVDLLTGQLSAKDAQIESLSVSLREVMGNLSSTTKALESAQREVEQAHALHAVNQGLIQAPEKRDAPQPQETSSKGFWVRLRDVFR